MYERIVVIYVALHRHRSAYIVLYFKLKNLIMEKVMRADDIVLLNSQRTKIDHSNCLLYLCVTKLGNNSKSTNGQIRSIRLNFRKQIASNNVQEAFLFKILSTMVEVRCNLMRHRMANRIEEYYGKS